MDKESLLQHFMANRPARKFKTNEQYALRLSKLARDNDKTDNTFLQPPEDVFKMLDNKPVSTKANILTAIIEYLLIDPFPVGTLDSLQIDQIVQMIVN